MTSRVCQEVVISTRHKPQHTAMLCCQQAPVYSTHVCICPGKYLVYAHYPLDWTFVCPTEIVAFSDRVKEFEAINCNVGIYQSTAADAGADVRCSPQQNLLSFCILCRRRGLCRASF
jgi:hypothetical protein